MQSTGKYDVVYSYREKNATEGIFLGSYFRGFIFRISTSAGFTSAGASNWMTSLIQYHAEYTARDAEQVRAPNMGQKAPTERAIDMV